MKIDRITTKAGDSGETGIIGGGRVRKDCLQIESYGTIDELQALIGLLRVELTQSQQMVKDGTVPPLDHDLRQNDNPKKNEAIGIVQIVDVLTVVQQDLFDLGAILATEETVRKKSLERLEEGKIDRLDRWIEEWVRYLPTLQSFLLPGSGRCSAMAHHARTVCRRSERAVIRYARTSDVPMVVQVYLNRLSDLLFIVARLVSLIYREREILWMGGIL